MKILILISVFFSLTVNSYTQKTLDSISLYNDIVHYSQVETRHIGCYGINSTLFKKVDSLNKLLGNSSFINYYDDSSYILKYYSFLTLLPEDDDQAFKKLINSINDTTEIAFNFAGQNRGTTTFNTLIASEYLLFIKFKYYYGNGCTINGRSYQFEKKNRKAWRLKRNKLYSRINNSTIDKEFFKYYSN